MPLKPNKKNKTVRNNEVLPNIVQFPAGGNNKIWFDRSLRIGGKKRLKPLKFKGLDILEVRNANSSPDSSASSTAYDSTTTESIVSNPDFSVPMPLSGSSALDRCYVGGKGFSRFLKHQSHISPDDIWSDNDSYFSYIATTTQGAPYSSSDLIGSYNNDSTRLASTDDLRFANGGNVSDRRGKGSKDSNETRNSNKKNSKGLKVGSSIDKDQPSRHTEKPDNRYKSNHHSANNASTATDKDTKSAEIARKTPTSEFLKDYEGGRESSQAGLVPLSSSNKQSHSNYNNFRPLNTRNNFLGGQQINPLPSQQRCPTAQPTAPSPLSNGREGDELVAMGTNPLQSMGARGSGVKGRDGATFNGTNGGGVFYSQSSTGALGSLRKFNNKTNNVLTRNTKDSEPRYGDPFINAPPSFNQRIAEIQALEQETIRYERTKKFRKKKTDTT